LNNIKFGKRALALLLTAMVLASVVPLLPIQFSAKASPGTRWVFVLKDTLNETVRAGEAKVELWNYTHTPSGWTKIGKVAGPVTVGEGGMVEMDLPQMWNASGVGETIIRYVLVVKWTPKGKSTPFLLLNRTVLSLEGIEPGFVRAKIDGGVLMNMTEPVGAFPIIDPEVDNSLFGPDLEYPVYMVWLGRAVVQARDSSAFPLTGASVEMILNATDHSTTSFIQIVNGTLGSEFLGNIPNYDANDEVGWAVFDVPVNDTRADVTTWDGYDTNLANATFLIRWKVGAVDPRNGPVVGKFTVYYTMPTTLPDEIGPSVGVDASLGLVEFETALNNEIFAYCKVEWSLFFMTDMMGYPWYTEQAKLKAKAMKLDGSDFYATYPFVGARVAPGIYLMRLPFNLTSVDVWDFKLKADVQWYSSVVNVTTLDESTMLIYEGDVGNIYVSYYLALNCSMVSTRVWLMTSSELPEWVQNPWAAEILLPAETAGASGVGSVYTTIDWTSNLGQLVLPDTDAVMHIKDPLGLADLWEDYYGANYYEYVMYHFFMKNYEGWLPHQNLGETNLRVWYKGIKVLDTTEEFPSGATPISLTMDDWVNWYYQEGDPDNEITYHLAIYELGFVLKFKVDNATSLVPRYVPFFFKDPKGELIGPVGSSDGVYEIADAPIGNFSNFFILWKGSAIPASNVQSLYVNRNLPNIELLFPVYDLTIIPWSQDPFMIHGVNVSLFFRVDFSALGIPKYKLDSVLHSPEFIKAFLPTGKSKYTVLSEEPLVWWVELKPDWPFGVSGLVDFLSSWDNSTGTPRQMVKYEKLPPRTYDIRAFTVTSNSVGPEDYGFRVGDENVTLYWSQDKYPGVKPIVLNRTMTLDLKTYVYDPRIALRDATGKPLVINGAIWPENETSAVILADKFLTSEPNNYTLRYNFTDAEGKMVFFSYNASVDNYPTGCRFMIGGLNYSFTVYYKGVLVFNGTVTLLNPYVGKVNPITTSVYPYTFRADHNPYGDAPQLPVRNLNVTVTWAGLNTSLWADEDLVVGDEAVRVFSILNASKLMKSFDLEVVRLLGNAAVVAVRGITNANGEFSTLVPVWNYSNAREIFIKDDVYFDEESGDWSGTTATLPMFGTPLYVNYTTIPGMTPSIPEDDIPRLAGAWVNITDVDVVIPGGEVRWGLYSVNATGLMNKQSYTDPDTEGISLSPVNATGRLPGGVSQSPLVTKVLAFDIAAFVRDYFGNNLARQYVEVIRDEIELPDGSTIPAALELADYTPTTPPYGPLILRATKDKFFWGFYDYTFATTNVTKIATPVTQSLYLIWQKMEALESLTDAEKSAYKASLLSTWELYGVQWLTETLVGGEVDWNAADIPVVLQWPAKLQLIVHDGAGTRSLKGAWVVVVDAETGRNVTSAITDEQGYAGSLAVADARGPLATADGKRLNLGLNLFEGVYIVRIYYKYGGVTEIYAPITGTSVWDTFRDQPQHRFIYLGVAPPPTATGEDYRPAQERTINSKVWDIRVVVKDQTLAEAPVSGAKVTLKPYDISATTASTGEVSWALVPAGTYEVQVETPSAYGVAAKDTARIVLSEGPADVVVPASIYDATIRIVTPSGRPIVGAEVSVAGVSLGKTGATGEVVAPLIPAGSYAISAKWYGQDVSPAESLAVKGTRTYLMTASKVYTLQVRAVGAQEQGLAGAHVDVKLAGATIFSGVADSDGVVTLELPSATYSVSATYKGVSASQDVSLTADQVVTLKTAVFMELFGASMTFSTFMLWIIMVVIVVILLIIIAQEYNIYRRKKLPQLFGPAAPK
jgi:hypothetical protein